MFDPNYNALLFYWHTASWAFILAAIAVFLYGQYKRRSPHPICPKCGYDLTSIIRPEAQQSPKLPTLPPTCPECGYASKKPCFKHRLKRRFVLLAALLFLLSELLCIIPRAQRNGPIAFVPTWMLALCAPHQRTIQKYESGPFANYVSYWQSDAMFNELYDRIVHGDHNTLHIKLIVLRHNAKWCGDMRVDYSLRDYPAYNQKNPDSSLWSLIDHREFVKQEQARVYNTRWEPEFTWSLPKLELIYAKESIHSQLQSIINACESPFDTNFSEAYVDARVPESIIVLENTRFAAHANQEETEISLQRLSEVIHATTGLLVDLAAFELPLRALKVRDVQPSYHSATLAELLDQLTRNSWCNEYECIHWFVSDTQIHLCNTNAVPLIDVAYDFRLTLSENTLSHIGPCRSGQEPSLLYDSLLERLNFTNECAINATYYHCNQVDRRFLILAPLHIHARIQRLLPILRAELTLADKSQNP